MNLVTNVTVNHKEKIGFILKNKNKKQNCYGTKYGFNILGYRTYIYLLFNKPIKILEESGWLAKIENVQPVRSTPNTQRKI